MLNQNRIHNAMTVKFAGVNVWQATPSLCHYRMAKREGSVVKEILVKH